MTITVDIDDKLLEDARELLGNQEASLLVTEGLRVLIERKAARGLIALGGSQPELKPIPRRRPRK